MLKQAIKKVLRRNHFWRDVGFDELSELYISNMLRSVALTIFLIFVPFYLYQQGYSAVAICALFGSFFAIRAVADIWSAFLVARYGPKHTMIVSCILQTISSALLLTVPQVHWHILILALPWAAATSSFFVSYHVTFSKIKHTPKAGHELGHMQVFEKLGFMIGPLVGGVIGSVFGPEYIFMTATLMLLASLWPLFRTSEPTKVHQRLRFNDLPVWKIRRDLFANVCLGVENTLCVNTWAFYVAVFVLSGAVYAQLGALSAVGTLAAIIVAKGMGRMSDTHLARPLLQASAIGNALLYAIRPFVTGVWGVFGVNIVNDALNPGYRMPFIKGMYAAADELPGLRIVYLASMEATGSVVKSAVWFALAILATLITLKYVLFIGFVIAALASLGIMRERFAVYN